jgi:DNA-binding response OmpR family regulator
VIMVTAKGHEREVLNGLRGGAVDYIVKPFSLKELSARVELALRREPPATQL